MRNYLGIFTPAKKTVNRSSNFIFIFQILSAFAQTRERHGITTKSVGINICSEK
ncbi:hypothetical protein SF123566_7846 [Shigella flexneri 1235-66]|nr:hypothetical protein SF123566_7846 [Shigella flexneri 1235-66]